MFSKHFVLNEQSLAIIQQFGEHMPGGFLIYKVDENEELLYANDAVCRIYGCDGLEDFKALTGFTFRGMVHPDDYEWVSESIGDQLNETRDALDHIEYRIIHRDGEVRWVDDYGHYVESDVYHGLYYVFISDITDQHQRTESDKVLRTAVIEALTRVYDSVWLIDNIETQHFQLYRVDEVLSHLLPANQAIKIERFSDAFAFYSNLVLEEDRQEFLDAVTPEEIVRNTEQRIIYSVPFRRVFETGVRHYRLEFAKLDLGNGRTGIVTGFKDVDDEVRREQQIQQALRDAVDAANASNKAKSDFLSNMSHDIRTPMNAIIGYTNLARNADSIEDVQEYLDKIDMSSGQLLALINDILEMSRIESGKVERHYEPADLRAIIDEIGDLFTEQMRQKNLEFSVHTSQMTDNLVWCDKRNLNRVLLNLVSNAYKFTPEGGSVSITLWQTGAAIGGYGSYEMSVEDTGIGMSREFVDKMFTAFERERTSTDSGIEGTGLGLAITKSLVDLMGGTIEVLTSPGGGTKIVIGLKLKIAQEDDVPKAKDALASDANSEINFSEKRLLLVEDNAINMEIAKMILDQQGFMVEEAENGQVAVDMVSQSEPGYYDAILMDVQMPVMNGYEATRAIRALDDKALASTPILAMTANAFQEDVQAAKDAGMQAHIAKPIDVAVLVEELAAVLK